MLKQQIEFFLCGAETKRYHTIKTISEETVGHHSHGVAMFCYMMGASADLLMGALTHDLSEHQLGDVPAPAKQAYGIREQVNKWEATLLSDASLLFKLSEEEERILKFADIFQGMSFCLREIQMGNHRMHEVFGRYSNYATELVPSGRAKAIFDVLMADYYREVSRGS